LPVIEFAKQREYGVIINTYGSGGMGLADNIEETYRWVRMGGFSLSNARWRTRVRYFSSRIRWCWAAIICRMGNAIR
jgi:hypothetical protein